MGIVAVKIKIMPVSPETNMKKIGQKAKELIGILGGKNCTISEESIAFGLKAILIFFAWSEEKELEILENKLKKIDGVNSVQVMDMRRAF